MTPIRYHPNYLRIAFQGAFITALCIGLPAGLVFWGFLLKTSLQPPFANFVELLLIDNPVVVPCVVLLGAAGWGWALSRITSYPHVVRLAFATGVTVFFSSRYMEMLMQRNPGTQHIHIQFAINLIMAVCIVSGCAGIAIGIALQSWQAIIKLALSGSMVAALATLVIVFLLDLLGLRVGTGNAAMVKVTALSTLSAAFFSGAVISVVLASSIKRPEEFN